MKSPEPQIAFLIRLGKLGRSFVLVVVVVLESGPRGQCSFENVDSCRRGLLSRREASDFVPQGLNDRSQAILLPGTRPMEDPSHRARSDSCPELIHHRNRGTPSGPNHTVP